LVLSVLVARGSGQPLGAFFSTRIFEPLGMTETGFFMPAEHAGRLPSYYMTNFETRQLELQTLSGPEVWTRPPVFPSGAGGLLSTVDDYLAFARLLLNGGVHDGRRLLSEESVSQLTTNRLTPEQIAGGGPFLDGRGWGFGMGVVVQTDETGLAPGGYGWSGGYGTDWFNDPNRKLVAIAMTQTSDFLWNGGMAEFAKLAAGS
jgi:CubicO group peptidase (beta-lactamase class C family)